MQICISIVLLHVPLREWILLRRVRKHALRAFAFFHFASFPFLSHFLYSQRASLFVLFSIIIGGRVRTPPFLFPFLFFLLSSLPFRGWHVPIREHDFCQRRTIFKRSLFLFCQSQTLGFFSLHADSFRQRVVLSTTIVGIIFSVVAKRSVRFRVPWLPQVRSAPA